MIRPFGPRLLVYEAEPVTPEGLVIPPNARVETCLRGIVQQAPDDDALDGFAGVWHGIEPGDLVYYLNGWQVEDGMVVDLKSVLAVDRQS